MQSCPPSSHQLHLLSLSLSHSLRLSLGLSLSPDLGFSLSLSLFQSLAWPRALVEGGAEYRGGWGLDPTYLPSLLLTLHPPHSNPSTSHPGSTSHAGKSTN